jgi:hypothetical protein
LKFVSKYREKDYLQLITRQSQGVFSSFLCILSVIFVLNTILTYTNQASFIEFGSMIVIPTAIIVLLTILSFFPSINKVKLNMVVFLLCICTNIIQLSLDGDDSVPFFVS